ncbi:GerAB/ArcD/ProY family transporter [Paenibacillus radicis (ex Gao et al. 2016)]|uniref:Spore germination protein KB n=1 Tax=Paenibacillus radicis (ex Gao et al. 2016) TaxID=1737354 RepID=A0A917M1J1_9BACL|nr:GerAB/ArcD/ProY family transporter [Paenibacillus radicis (ex Gao et al. 2016)]GGG70630.1 spore germination protein KB [Paenibacillus radicis (ex Gao et al. 2016)]
MEIISRHQLLTISIIYQIGTTIIFGFASGAGRDSWLAVLISTCLGTAVVWIYTRITHFNPGLTYIECYPAQFGKLLGTPIAWLHPLLFLYISGRIVADIKNLVPTTILPGTPPWVILLFFMLVISYGLFAGIEVMGKLTEIILPIILLIYLIEVILIFSSGVVHFDNLSPLLDKGWGRIWEVVWPLGIIQSFGESLALALVWTLMNERKRVGRTMIISSLFAGLFIAFTDALAVAVYGEEIFKRATYPMYALIQAISVSDFITQLDATGVIYFCFMAFLKTYIYLFATIRSIQKLTYSNSSRVFIFPVVLIALFMGLTMAPNVVEHIAVVQKVIPYNPIYLSLMIVFPVLLFLVSWIRNKSGTAAS